MNTKDQRDLFLSALIGSAVGAAAALFLTPVSGEKLRGRIQNFWNGSKNKISKNLPSSNGSESSPRTTKRVSVSAKATSKSPQKRKVLHALAEKHGHSEKSKSHN